MRNDAFSYYGKSITYVCSAFEIVHFLRLFLICQMSYHLAKHD